MQPPHDSCRVKGLPRLKSRFPTRFYRENVQEEIMVRLKLSRCTAFVLILLAAALALRNLLSVQVSVQVQFPRRGQPKCDEQDVKLFLDDICHMYHQGLIGGTYCSSLCSGASSPKFVKCPKSKNGEKFKVFFVSQNDRDVVVKTHSQLPSPFVMRFKQILNGLPSESSHANIIAILNQTTRAALFQGQRPTPPSILVDIVKECDYNSDGVVAVSEALSCFDIVTSKEYLMCRLLHDVPGIPNVYGTCGKIFAMESLNTDHMYIFLQNNPRPWNQCARMVLSFLNLIKNLESTPYGVAYMCDAYENNFAVNSEDTVYAIDLDTVYFEEEVRYELSHLMEIEHKCSVDADCHGLVSCVTKCNKTSGMCQDKLMSSNLEVICKHLLVKTSPLHSGLLLSPPGRIKEHLRQLLNASCDPRSIVRKSDSLVLSSPHIMEELKTLLLNSLQ